MTTSIQIQAREDAITGLIDSAVEKAVAARTAELVALLGASQASAAEWRAQVADARHEATHDTLTGLLNRKWLTDAWEGDKKTTGLAMKAAGLIMLDLNGFKPVNDKYGHAAGDEVLKVIGERLADLVKDLDGSAAVRLGGDEFVLVASKAVDPVYLGEQAYKAIRQPIAITADLTVSVSAAVGIRVLDGPADLSDVLAQADEAMYLAKANKGTKRDTVAVWTAPVKAWTRKVLADHDLRLRDVNPIPRFVHASYPIVTSTPVEPVTVCAVCGGLLGYQGMLRNGTVRQVPVHVEAGDCDTPEPAVCTHPRCHADHSLDTTCSELRDRCCGRCGCLNAWADFEGAE